MMVHILNYIVPFIRSKSAVLFVVILGLCAWSWGQSQKISSLKAENQTQAQTIKQNEQFIEQLNKSIEQVNNQLEQEKQAVEMQSKIANELRKQVEVKRESVKVVLQKEPCGVATLPSSVINELKRVR